MDCGERDRLDPLEGGKTFAPSSASRLLQKVPLLIICLINSHNRPRRLPIRSRGLPETQSRRVTTPLSPLMIPRKVFIRALPLPETLPQHVYPPQNRQGIFGEEKEAGFVVDRSTCCCLCII